MNFPSSINNKAGGSLLTIDDLAKRLSVSKGTIHNYIKSDRVPPPIRLGNNLRWRPEQINEWIEAGMPEGSGDAE